MLQHVPNRLVSLTSPNHSNGSYLPTSSESCFFTNRRLQSAVFETS